MATLTEVRNTIDAFLVAHSASIDSNQAAYMIANGVYFQGLPTHTINPTHTNVANGAVVPDNLATKPTDQDDNWLTFYAMFNSLAMPASMICDCYHSELGDGYTITLWFSYDGKLNRRIINNGPETWRESAWVEYDPTPF